MIKRLFAASAVLVFLSPASRAEFPVDLIHPGVTLQEIPLGATQLDVMGVSFFPDGRMLLASTDFMAGGEVPTPQATSNVWIVTGVTGDLSNVVVKKVGSMFLQPVGAVATPGGKAYISDRDGLYELLDVANPADVNANRKKVINYPYQGAPNTNFTHGTSWHQWCFTPTYYNGKLSASYSGSIQPGGPSATPATSPWSGSFVAIDPTTYDQPYTAMEKIAGGLRSPNGTNVDENGNMYYSDNQGAWVPSSTFIHVVKGNFYGHRQSGFPANWAENMPYEPPTAWLPHGRVRRSPSQPLYLDRGFFHGDWLLGDVNDPGLLRIGIDRADGNNDHQNGAVFFFSGGFGTAGLNRMAWNTKENSIVVAPFGTINGNWPDPVKRKPTWKMTIADKPDAFEMKGIYSRVGGLLVTFTQAIDKTTPASAFTVVQWDYHRTATYGCCQDNNENRTVSSVQYSTDGMSAYLKIDGLKNNHPGGAVTDYLTDVKLGTIKSAAGAALFYNEAWYTMNYQSSVVFDPAATSVFNPTVAAARMDKAISYRRNGAGLDVSVDLEGEYTVSLADISGRVFGSRDARGTSQFSLPIGSARGLCMLWIRQGGISRSRQVLL